MKTEDVADNIIGKTISEIYDYIQKRQSLQLSNEESEFLKKLSDLLKDISRRERRKRLLAVDNAKNTSPDIVSTLMARHIAVTQFGYADAAKTSIRIRKAITAGKIAATREVDGWQINRESLLQWLNDPEQHRRGRRWKAQPPTDNHEQSTQI